MTLRYRKSSTVLIYALCSIYLSLEQIISIIVLQTKPLDLLLPLSNNQVNEESKYKLFYGPFMEKVPKMKVYEIVKKG